MPGKENNQDDRRRPSQNTIDNSIAIGKLVAIQERTTNDVDRIVKHIEKILPIHEQIATMRKILYGSIVIAIAFASWVTIAFFDLKESHNSHVAVQEERRINEKKNSKEKDKEEKGWREQAVKRDNDNKNQITWLKGAKMNKPKG